jgi:hypothetical protein
MVVDGHFAAKVLVIDATDCKMNLHYLTLMLIVHYISQHFPLALHTVGLEWVQDWEI